MRKVLYIFGVLGESDIDWLVQAGKRRTVPDGAALIEEGRPIDALFIVLAGKFSVSISAPTLRTLAQVGCGEILGELSFLDARPPSATVRALEPAQVLAVPRDLLAEKLEADHGFAARFYHALGILLARRLRNNLGYSDGKSLSEDVVYDDELDPELLESVALAGARFDWLLKRVAG